MKIKFQHIVLGTVKLERYEKGSKRRIINNIKK